MEDNNDNNMFEDESGLDPVEELRNIQQELSAMAKSIDRIVGNQKDPSAAVMQLSKQVTGNLMPLLVDFVASVGVTVSTIIDHLPDADDEDSGLLSLDTVADIGTFLLAIKAADPKEAKKPEFLTALKTMAEQLTSQISQEVPDFEQLSLDKVQQAQAAVVAQSAPSEIPPELAPQPTTNKPKATLKAVDPIEAK